MESQYGQEGVSTKNAPLSELKRDEQIIGENIPETCFCPVAQYMQAARPALSMSHRAPGYERKRNKG